MTKHLAWYKRCPADWQRGTRRHAMSFQLRGFYSECLDAMWEIQGQLPKDAKVLSMMLGTNARMVRALMPQLIQLGKMIETDEGYYNRRMMADILGLDDIKPTGQFAPASGASQRQVDADSVPIQSPVVNDSATKIKKNPMFSTRDLETETETEKKSPKGVFDDPCNSEGVQVAPDGSVDLVNGVRQFWLAEFGGDEHRLALALKQINVQPNSRRPVRAQVESQLARQASERLDRDARYDAAVKRNGQHATTAGSGPNLSQFLAKLQAKEAAR